MGRVLNEMRKSPLLSLLVFVPVVLAGEKIWPEKRTLLFLLSILAVVPLAAFLSEVAARTGDAVRGFPVAAPFLFLDDVTLALRLSAAVEFAMLFLTGFAFGQHVERAWRTGLLTIGIALVAVALALGGWIATRLRSQSGAQGNNAGSGDDLAPRWRLGDAVRMRGSNDGGK